MPVPAAGLPNTDAPLAAWPNAEALLLLLFEPNAEPLPSAPNPDGFPNAEVDAGAPNAEMPDPNADPALGVNPVVGPPDCCAS